MSITKFVCGSVLLALVCRSTGIAQQLDDDGLPPVEYQPVSLWPPHMGESYDHDSTAVGNYLRGLAGLTHSRGGYLVNRSQAAILSEYARSLDMLNRQQWIKFYRANLKRLETERQEKLAARRAKNEAKRITTYKAAYRLSDEVLDRHSGNITWPIVLRAEQYTTLRTLLDAPFQQWATDIAHTNKYSEQIINGADELHRSVKRNIKGVEKKDYAAAQKFLCGLKYEPEFSKSVSMAMSISMSDGTKFRAK